MLSLIKKIYVNNYHLSVKLSRCIWYFWCSFKFWSVNYRRYKSYHICTLHAQLIIFVWTTFRLMIGSTMQCWHTNKQICWLLAIIAELLASVRLGSIKIVCGHAVANTKQTQINHWIWKTYWEKNFRCRF